MRIEPIPVRLYIPEPKEPREIGIHASGIIRCAAMEYMWLKPQYIEELSLVDAREITDPIAILRINIGLAWEAHYIPMIGDVVDHPDQIRVDGIWMSPDGESVSQTFWGKLRLIVHEVKATYKSTRTVGNLHTQRMWLMQVMTYCKGMKTRNARLHVLFICGNYSMPITPILKVWDIEFDQWEIDQNWTNMLAYVEAKISQGVKWFVEDTTPKPPRRQSIYPVEMML